MPDLRPAITNIAELKKAIDKKRKAVLKSQEIADSSIFIGGLRHGWEDSLDFVNGLLDEFEASVRGQSIKRLKEIIKIAYKLKWTYPPNKTSYPLMQLSEVEKCMLAMVDDFELKRMREWYKDAGGTERV